MLRFIDPKILEGKSGGDLAKIVVDSQENQLSVDKIIVGAKTERFLKKLSPHDARRERENCNEKLFSCCYQLLTEETSLTR